MFRHTRPKPHTLLSYEALLRSLKPQHRNHPLIQKDYARHAAGFQGEKYVDYTLSVHPLPNSLTYPDIRLKHKRHHFQIDTLIITPSFILIMEIKNMTGVLSYDSVHDQFIQTVGGERKRQRNPVQQSMAQKLQFAEWLKPFGLPPAPIETLSVISNPNAIIDNLQEAPAVFDQLIHVEALPKKLQNLMKKHPTSILTQQHRQKLYKLFAAYNEPYKPDLIGHYGLEKRHFMKGIPCGACPSYPLQRFSGKWICPKCGFTSRDAHERVILDAFLLGKSTLTNSVSRTLLQFDDSNKVYYLLKVMGLRTTGTHKGTKYHPPAHQQFPQNSTIPTASRLSIR